MVRTLAGIFNETITLLPLFGYEMIIANSPLRASLAIYLTIIPWARVGYEIIIANSALLIDSQRKNTQVLAVFVDHGMAHNPWCLSQSKLLNCIIQWSSF